MGVDLGKLKKGRAAPSKGTPPPADRTADAVADDPRSAKAAQRPLQLRVPVAVFEEFSERAGREFGFAHGSKKRLFLKMWEAYKARGR